MSDFADWIGRRQRSADRLDAARAARWCATFDRDAPSDEAMPQGIHFCLCTPEARTSRLGEDGHPARDDGPASFLPPVPLPRRMWAGSVIRFHAALTIGATVERVSRIASINDKSGSRGRMVFIEIEHETAADGILAVSERQTLVYLEALDGDAPLSPPEPGSDSGADRFDPSQWDAHRTIIPDPRLLFRYSALTFNTHRIHYDAPYARDVERYRGPVVHGPLTASLLLQLAAERHGENRLASFRFKGLSPAIAGEKLHLVCRETSDSFELAAFADDGRQITQASAKPA